MKKEEIKKTKKILGYVNTMWGILVISLPIVVWLTNWHIALKLSITMVYEIIVIAWLINIANNLIKNE